MKFEDRSQEETERQERCVRGDAWKLAKNICKLKKKEKATFYSLSDEWVLAAASTKTAGGKRILEQACIGSAGKTSTLPNIGNREDIEKSDVGGDSQRRGASKRRGNGKRPWIWLIRDGHASSKYTSSSLTCKTLRRILVQLSLDEWPETTSHQEKQENPLWHIKSCTIRRTWFIHEFLYLINFSYNLIAGNCDKHGNSSNKKKWKCERICTGNPLHMSAEIENPNENDDAELQSDELQGVPDRLQEFKHGLFDKVFQNTEILPVFLMNYLWSREQKWHRVKTTCLFTSRKTGIATSVWGRKYRGLLAEDALVQSCPERKILVIKIIADHKVLSEGCDSWHNHRYAFVVQDMATHLWQSYPCKTKTSQEASKNLMKFLEPSRKPKVIYTDSSLEFDRSCEELSWNHCTSTPHRSETNGIAERAVRRVKEGTSAVLLQSGLDNEWSDSMECCCYLRNIQDLLSDGKTPYERRFGEPIIGPIIPFGALVEYHPISAKDLSRIHQFAPPKVSAWVAALRWQKRSSGEYVFLSHVGKVLCRFKSDCIKKSGDVWSFGETW